MSDDRKTGREALDEITTRLGDLFGAVKDAFGAAERGGDASSGTSSGAKDFTVDTPKGPVSARAEWRFRSGSVDDAIAARNGGDAAPVSPINRPAAEAAAPQVRDCFVETFDERDVWILTAELPGVAADEIRLRIDGAVAFETVGARRYAHTAEISPSIAAGPPQLRLANGILEIRLPKAG